MKVHWLIWFFERFQLHSIQESIFIHLQLYKPFLVNFKSVLNILRRKKNVVPVLHVLQKKIPKWKNSQICYKNLKFREIFSENAKYSLKTPEICFHTPRSIMENMVQLIGLILLETSSRLFKYSLSRTR